MLLWIDVPDRLLARCSWIWPWYRIAWSETVLSSPSVSSPALFPPHGQCMRGREQCCAHSRYLIKTRTIISIVLFYFFLPDTFPRESAWSRVAKQNETMGFRIWRPISYPSSSHFLPKSQLPRLFFLRQLHYCPSSPPLVDSISWISLGSVYFSKPCRHHLS